MTDDCYCDWDEDTGKAQCILDEETVEHSKPGTASIASESNAPCLPTFRIGASCGSDPGLEGTMRCDETCTNVVCDHQPLDM